MFELFPDGPVYEYSQILNITYSFLWAFVLSSLIAITHRLTATGDSYPKNFFQSLILGAIVTTMVMMAIGDSLARGLGVFGAMAIIRFRTRIDDPRDVLFLFAALSTGLAIGVYGFTISFAGTILFCAVAFLLHFSPFRTYSQKHNLYFTIKDATELGSIVSVFNPVVYESRLISQVVTKENDIRYHYLIVFRADAKPEELLHQLHQLPNVRQIKIASSELPES